MSEPIASVSRQTLPSGRAVELAVAGSQENVLIRAPDGTVEVKILLDENGPRLQISAGRLELAAEELSVNCQQLDINAETGVNIRGGEFRVKTEKSVHLNGETIRLNCNEDGTMPIVSALPSVDSHQHGCCGEAEHNRPKSDSQSKSEQG